MRDRSSDDALGPDPAALREAFARVEVWVFDLDNTLYPAECRLFDQIDKRMTAFIAEELRVDHVEANRLRADYWTRHGTTLNGLMREHGMAPEAFLDFVHDIDLSGVAAAPGLCAALDALPGRKIVYTNGTRAHAERVTGRLGVSECFDGLYGIEDSGHLPKPQRAAYDSVFARAGITPSRGAMVEDTARNLIEPHLMGMRTVWTPTDCALASDGAEGEHVHFTALELESFLSDLAVALRSA